jgi:PAS domain S-box-containing protein
MYNALNLITSLIDKLIHSAILVSLPDKKIITFNNVSHKLHPNLATNKLITECINFDFIDFNEITASQSDIIEKDEYIFSKYLINNKNYLLIELKNEFSLSEKIQTDILFTKSLNLIIISDSNGIINFISDNCIKFTGYSKKELLNKCFYDLLLPGEFEKLDTYSKQVVDNRKAGSLEIKIKHKNNSTVILDTENIILYSLGNTSNIKYLTVARDITRKKRTQDIFNSRLRIHEFAKETDIKGLLQKTLDETEKLTESKIGFYHFVDEENGMLKLQNWSTNTLKTFCKINEFNDLYEISKAGVWSECLTTRNVVVHNDYQSLSHKKGYPEGHAHVERELVVPVIRKNKIVAILGVGNKEYPYDDFDIKITQQLADITWDIVELKLKELELEKQKDKFKALFNSAPVGIALIKDRIIYDANNALCDFFGTTRENLINKKTEIFYNSIVDYEKVGQLLKDLGKTKKITIETTLKKPDNTILDVILNISCFDCSENSNFIIASVVDITKQKTIENKFKSIVIELKQKSINLENLLNDKNDLIQMLAISELKLKKTIEEKDKFFSVIAHDLRSPFQGLLGLSQIIAENFNDLTPEDVIRFSGQLRDSARNLYTLLENLLEWSRIKRGMVVPVFTNLPLIHVVNECVSLFKNNAEIKKQQITVNIAENIVINVDYAMFNSILRNLLTNAIKFSYIGGIITVSATEIENNYVRISIHDNGIGISEEDLMNLFRIDKKVSQKGTSGEPSTGLGLILCKEYIEIMGGSIWVNSNKKEGTTFYFTVKKTVV